MAVSLRHVLMVAAGLVIISQLVTSAVHVSDKPVAPVATAAQDTRLSRPPSGPARPSEESLAAFYGGGDPDDSQPPAPDDPPAPPVPSQSSPGGGPPAQGTPGQPLIPQVIVPRPPLPQ